MSELSKAFVCLAGPLYSAKQKPDYVTPLLKNLLRVFYFLK